MIRNRTSLGEEWRFTYHEGYTEITDVLGRTEQYHYDYNNELTKRVFADGSTNLMERDDLGRLLSHTDAMGRVTRYQYSNEGQQAVACKQLYFSQRRAKISKLKLSKQ